MKTAHKVLIGIGITTAAVCLYNGAQKRCVHPPIYVRKSLAGGYNARTIPPFGIFIREDQVTNKALIEHELIHWKQYQQLGLIGFYRQYYNELKEFGYDKMPMEIEARFNESDYCKLNYTECVRAGKALTINNQNFRK